MQRRGEMERYGDLSAEKCCENNLKYLRNSLRQGGQVESVCSRAGTGSSVLDPFPSVILASLRAVDHRCCTPLLNQTRKNSWRRRWTLAFLWPNLVGHSCGILLSHALVIRTLLWDVHTGLRSKMVGFFQTRVSIVDTVSRPFLGKLLYMYITSCFRVCLYTFIHLLE